jgi:hypothetical protein
MSYSRRSWYFPVFDYEHPQRVGCSRAPHPPVAWPQPPRRALTPPTSSSTALRPRSCAEQRRRLSLTNSICSSGIVILRGSKSSCAGRGHVAKMQSTSCQLRMEYFESHFHLKLVLESEPFHFFYYVSSNRSGSEPLYKNLTGMLPGDIQVRWTQSSAHPNGSFNILLLGSHNEEMSLMHILGNAESKCRMIVRGPYILVVRLVFFMKFATIQERMCVHFDSTTWPKSLS